MRSIKNLIPFFLVTLFVAILGNLSPAMSQTPDVGALNIDNISTGLNFENLLTYTPMQHSIVQGFLTLGYAAQAAGLVYFLSTMGSIAPRYRLSSALSAVVMVSAFLELWRLAQDWQQAFTFTDGLWRPINDAFSNGFRYVNWSIDVPVLLIQLVVVLGLTRKEGISYATKFTIGGLLMIWTGYIGQFYEVTDPIPFWIWGAISTVFYIYVLFVVWKLISKEADNLPTSPDNLPKMMRFVRTYLFITWSIYPIAYIIPAFWFDGWGVVARQIIYTIADITSKVIYGVILGYIARKRSEAIEYEPAVATARR